MTSVVHGFVSVFHYVRRVISGQNDEESQKSLTISQMKESAEEKTKKKVRNCCAGDVQNENAESASEMKGISSDEDFEETEEYYERQSAEDECTCSISSSDTLFGISSLPYSSSVESVTTFSQNRRRERMKFLRKRWLKDPEFRKRYLKVRVVRRLQIRPKGIKSFAEIQKQVNQNNRYLGENMSSYESWTWSE